MHIESPSIANCAYCKRPICEQCAVKLPGVNAVYCKTCLKENNILLTYILMYTEKYGYAVGGNRITRYYIGLLLFNKMIILVPIAQYKYVLQASIVSAAISSYKTSKADEKAYKILQEFAEKLKSKKALFLYVLGDIIPIRVLMESAGVEKKLLKSFYVMSLKNICLKTFKIVDKEPFYANKIEIRGERMRIQGFQIKNNKKRRKKYYLFIARSAENFTAKELFPLLEKLYNTMTI
ncbi:MAG: hypothetical protein DRJ38_05070 [Thermoprotei archaeon]|nr:MAG: hypothetical protein DRJ38_05070 [Thermoprotei archaeon]